MQKNVLEYLETIVDIFPDRIVYQSQADSISFLEVLRTARKLGSLIAKKTTCGQPVAVIADKNIQTPVIYLGIAYAGCYYIPLSTDLPDLRIQAILDFVKPALILTDDENFDSVKSKNYPYPVVCYREAGQIEIDEAELKLRHRKQLDTDPFYVIFTSGSSGIPKGVITSHRSVINYIDVFVETFGIGSDDVLGNQAPLDYIAAIRDIYIPLKTGAKTVMIPKSLFSTPVKLFTFVNENKITTICWVAPALSLCNELGVFKETKLNTVTKVFFTGSIMPCKHLKVWQKNLPNALFVNHYGPTEITASCSYYIVDHPVTETEVLPIGCSFNNADVFLLSDQGDEVPMGKTGEICVRGTGLALGYYKDKAKTDEFFVANPLNGTHSERIYKTGDLGSMGTDGMIRFHGRKDFQIKHMGHRIELGEIESTANSMQKIRRCCCLYQETKSVIWLFFTGDTDSKELSIYLRQRLPGYMIPRKFIKLDEMPILTNGKTDVNALKKMMEE